MSGTNSQGCKLLIEDSAGSATFTETVGVRDLTTPSESIGVLDTTTLASTYKEKILDIPDGGEVTFTLVWDGNQATQQKIRDIYDDQKAGTAGPWNFKVALNDDDAAPSTCPFAAWVTKPPVVKAGPGNALIADVTITVTGVVGPWTYPP